MSSEEATSYTFDRFRVDVSDRVVVRDDGEVLPLKPKAFDTLLYLVRNPGRVVERDEMLAAIWADTVVEENNLTQHISALRRLLGDKRDEHRFIVTIPGRGYKFVPEVRANDQLEPSIQPAPDSIAIDRKPERPPRRHWAAIIGAVVVFGLVAVAFTAWRGGSASEPTGRIESLAVLPFKPLVEGVRDESLELGMADTMIAKLSSGEIRVRPLTAVRRFNAIDQDPIAAGRALGVQAVLDGRIQIANDRVRISAALIRVSDGKQLWADQYNAAASDIFGLQDSISERVAAALLIALADRSRKNYTASVEAYQLYSKGKFHSSRLILPEVQKGISYFEQAIAVDPDYAMAYVEISNACRALLLTNDARPSEVMPKARSFAERATQLDPTLAEAQAALASTAFWHDFDPKRSEALFLRAIELDPQSSQSHFGYAHLLSNIGRHDEALAEIRRTREMDPVSLVTNALEGQILFFAGRQDEAQRVLQATIDLDDSFWLPHLFATRISIARENWNEAMGQAEKASYLSNGNSEAVATIGYVHAKAGRSDEARKTLAELEARSKTGYVPSYGVAAVHHALGDSEKALDLLERSYAERDALMVFLKVDPKWDGLRKHPRFVALMRSMNFI